MHQRSPSLEGSCTIAAHAEPRDATRREANDSTSAPDTINDVDSRDHARDRLLADTFTAHPSQRHGLSVSVTGNRGITASAIDRALRRIGAEITDGLRHGYFEFSLTCEVIGQGRRRLVLHAGKSYQFLLTVEDCTGKATSDPQHADALDVD